MKNVSVVMSCYNEKEQHLIEAIESILNQKYTEFEFLIVVDNPNNNTLGNIIKMFEEKDDRIVVIRNEQNLGLAKSLNRGIDIAQGKYIARMDADDVSLPERLITQVNYMEKNPDCSLVCGSFFKIDENGSIIGENKRIPKSDAKLMKCEKHQNIIPHPTVMFRRDEFKKIGGYNNFVATQDYDLWLRMLQNKLKMHYIPAPLINYRFREGSIGNEKRIIQFVSYRYAKDLFISKKPFDDAEYYELIGRKQEDLLFCECVKMFYEGVSSRRIIKLIESVVKNKECRMELQDIILERCCEIIG